MITLILLSAFSYLRESTPPCFTASERLTFAASSGFSVGSSFPLARIKNLSGYSRSSGVFHIFDD